MGCPVNLVLIGEGPRPPLTVKHGRATFPQYGRKDMRYSPVALAVIAAASFSVARWARAFCQPAQIPTRLTERPHRSSEDRPPRSKTALTKRMPTALRTGKAIPPDRYADARQRQPLRPDSYSVTFDACSPVIRS